MRNLFSIAVLLTILAFPFVLATSSSSAHADINLPSPSPEWSGIKSILSIMGQGALSPADQKSILDILDTKSAVEEGKNIAPMTYPVTPFRLMVSRKQPPHHSPSAF